MFNDKYLMFTVKRIIIIKKTIERIPSAITDVVKIQNM